MESWRSRANCIGRPLEWFFPAKGETTREAEATCLRCFVRNECLKHAVQFPERHGVWGGKSARARQILIWRVGSGRAVNGSSETSASGPVHAPGGRA